MFRRMLLVLLILGVSSSASAEKWYEGGTLHKATGGEWHRATSRNQLATAADFVAAAKVASSMEQLRVRAAAVQRCITEATDDPKLYSLKVSEVASACIVQLGYK